EHLMQMTEAMLADVARASTGATDVAFNGHQISLAGPYRRLSLRHAAAERASAKLGRAISEADLRDRDTAARAAKDLGFDVPPGAGAGKIATEIFERLWQDDMMQPTFVHDFPTEVSPLSKQKPD